MEDQFNSNPTGGYDEAAGTAARMKEEGASKTTEMKSNLTDFGRRAAEGIDSQREPVATGLNKTASALRQQGNKATTAIHKTADKLELTADYLRNHDLKAMGSDIQGLARRYPGQSLVAALTAGFLIGRLFRKTD